MRDLCDVAYVLLLASMEAQVLAERVVGAVMAAAGADGIEVQSMDVARVAFDAALVAAPVPESTQVRILRELGVA